MFSVSKLLFILFRTNNNAMILFPLNQIVYNIESMFGTQNSMFKRREKPPRSSAKIFQVCLVFSQKRFLVGLSLQG